MANLDDIDRKLLAELQAEGRVTNVDLAQRVGLTAPPCLRRVRRFFGNVCSTLFDIQPYCRLASCSLLYHELSVLVV